MLRLIWYTTVVDVAMMALSQKLTERLHEYRESLPNKMYAHADHKEFGDLPLASI